MKPTSDQARFWQWFANNSERLQAAIIGGDGPAREAAMKELAQAGEEAAPGLVLEMCARRDGRAHELIVSVDGDPALVDAAKDFVDAAPAVAGWNVIAFRPRDEIAASMEIVLADERVSADDIWFRVAAGSDGLDLTLYVRGLTQANKAPRGLAAFLFAEHAVGERDTLTLLNAQTAAPLPEAPACAGLRPIGELADVFDRVKAKKYPPPGRLPVGDESEWATVQGTKNGSPLMGILHLGLRAVAGHPGYDWRLTVRIPFRESNRDGFPATREEYLAVCDLEERLTDVLQEGQQSLLAVAIIAEGRRELFFYTANADAALERLERFRAGVVSHDLESEVERDTFWGLYRSFCQSPGGDEVDED
jgi:hypothetical protein